MDRLSALAVGVAVAGAVTLGGASSLGGCNDGRTSSGDPPSRVNGAKTAVPVGATSAAFCDVHPAAAAAVPFQLPALAAGTLPAAGKGWRWINVWATWCKPCVEELPRLARWRDKLGAAGMPIELAFVSVDESDAVVNAFRELHPETPPSLRLAAADQQGAWFVALGLDAAAPIPVHVFVDPAGKTRCVRAGGVREQDFAAVERLLRE
ncbi:MAG: TlpA family protein disulfide reductase [Deltaproteobacteria bacterium]|nr:TlpA family protein disulfide reductase [Deltaproteobacteria bacterium]